MQKTLMAFALLAATILCAAELTDAEWSQLKQAALSKPRPIVVNHDGCDATAWHKDALGELTSLEQFYGYMLNNFKGSKASVLSYCPYGVGLSVSVPTKVGEQVTKEQVIPNFENVVDKVQALSGKDPMQLSLEFARANGLEFFACMRVNDCHDMHFPTLLSTWKKEHPEYMVGSETNRPPRGEWTAFDFARPEVRKRFVDVVTELMENYDVDGLELDFCRMTLFFKSIAWDQPVSQQERDGMTDAIRQIRANAERIGRARKHPIVLLFHLIDSPEVCRAMGLDVEKWMQEGLFDIYAGGSDRGTYNTAERLSECCRKYGVQYYGVICDPYYFPRLFERNTPNAMRGMQAYQLAAGAKGVYMFNYHYQKVLMDAVGKRLEDIQLADKVYFVAHQHENNYGVQPDEYRKYNRIPELTPWKQFYGAVRKDYVLQIGDDFASSAYAALQPDEMPTATLYLDVLGDAELLDVFINGRRLQAGERNGTVVAYEVPLPYLHQGCNILTFDAIGAAGSGSATQRFIGDSLAFARPWWSIYRSGAGTKGNDAEGGYYFLNDNMTTPNPGIASMLRTISGIDGAPFALEFDLQTEKENSPESSLLRVADGRVLEIVDFRPGSIHLKYANLEVPFDTTDAFHRYSVQLADGCMTILADGKTLIQQARLPMAAAAPEARLMGHNYMVPADTNRESIYIGSLTVAGTGLSRWRNFDLKCDMIVGDAALYINFPARLGNELREAMERCPEPQVSLDFTDGKIPTAPGFSSNYVETTAAPDNGGIFLDNEVGTNPAMGMFLKNDDYAAGKKRFRKAEWRFTPVRPSKADSGQPVFQMSLMLECAPGKQLKGWSGCNCEALSTPWGSFPIHQGPLTVTILMDMEKNQGAVLLDGKLLASGPFEVISEHTAIHWGDLSRGAGGAVSLDYAKFTLWD